MNALLMPMHTLSQLLTPQPAPSPASKPTKATSVQAKPQAHVWLQDAGSGDALRALLLNLNVLPTVHANDGNAFARMAQALAVAAPSVAVIGLDAAAAQGHSLLTLAQQLPKASLPHVFLVQSKRAYVLPAMRQWARALGFADLLPQLSSSALLEPGQAPGKDAPHTEAPALAMARSLNLPLDAARAQQIFRAMGVQAAKDEPRAIVRQHTQLEAETLAQLWASSVRSITRRYHLQTYPACFLGSEATNWLRERFELGRKDAVAVGKAMLALGLIHHVAHEHEFEDADFFYRIAVSGTVDRIHLDAVLAALTGKTGVQVADRLYGTTNYPQCFVGSQAVDVMTAHYKLERHEALAVLDRLHALGLIEHVTREHRMRDGHFFYRLKFN
jgi:hypothetical protein